MQEASGRSRASLPTAQAASATAALRLAPRPLTPPQDREGGIAASTVLSELGKGPGLSEPQFPQR